jgi:hypothetical protein
MKHHTEARAEFEATLLTGAGVPDLRMNGSLYRNMAVECRWKGWNLGRAIPTEFEPLAKYYGITTLDELILAQALQIESLIARLQIKPIKQPPTMKPITPQGETNVLVS